MKVVEVIVRVRDTNTGERWQNQKQFTEFNLRQSRVPDFIARETQDVVNTLLDVINEE